MTANWCVNATKLWFAFNTGERSWKCNCTKFSLHLPAAARPCLPATLHTDLACKSLGFVLFSFSQCYVLEPTHPAASQGDGGCRKMPQRRRGGQVTELAELPQKERCPRQKLECVLTKGMLDQRCLPGGTWRVGARAAGSQLSCTRKGAVTWQWGSLRPQAMGEKSKPEKTQKEKKARRGTEKENDFMLVKKGKSRPTDKWEGRWEERLCKTSEIPKWFHHYLFGSLLFPEQEGRKEFVEIILDKVRITECVKNWTPASPDHKAAQLINIHNNLKLFWNHVKKRLEKTVRVDSLQGKPESLLQSCYLVPTKLSHRHINIRDKINHCKPEPFPADCEQLLAFICSVKSRR